MNEHIFLIGFMCSGKTRVGRELAPLLDLPFYDLDREIEARVGPILPFFERHGEAAFRREEQRMLEELMDGPDAVISTGGGTPCEGDNLELMQAAGIVVWLDLPLSDLMPRIERAGGDRPLLFGLRGDALRERVEELLEPRLPYYERAKLIVQANVEPHLVAERIRIGLGGLQPR
jgi:shikimate kinase